MEDKLPTKLKKEPLIDIIFEMRFESSVSVMDVLPGLFYMHSSGERVFERHNIADIPKQVRDQDPNLRNAPLTRLKSEGYGVGIGDRVINIGCQLPYKGWEKFKEKIYWALGIVNDAGVVKKVERFSLKYVDLLEYKELRDQISSINASLTVAGHELKDQTFNIRFDITEGNALHIVTIVPEAQVKLSSGETRHGIVIDVDSLVQPKDYASDDWFESMKTALEDLHIKNKKMFFNCITKDALEKLEPEYV